MIRRGGEMSKSMKKYFNYPAKLPAQRLKRSLNDIFGDMVHIDVHAYLEDGDLNIPILPEVTLASGENSYKRLLRNYPKESIIFAKRDVTLPVHFERVFFVAKRQESFSCK